MNEILYWLDNKGVIICLYLITSAVVLELILAIAILLLLWFKSIKVFRAIPNIIVMDDKERGRYDSSNRPTEVIIDDKEEENANISKDKETNKDSEG